MSAVCGMVLRLRNADGFLAAPRTASSRECLDALGLVHNVPQGAYYVMMDISEFGYDSDLKFCEELAAKVGVGAVPGSSFFREPVNHLIRFHFAKKDETLNDALNRLEALRSKIPAKAAR